MVSGRDRDPGYNKKKVTKPLEQTPVTDKTTPTPPEKLEQEPTSTPNAAETTMVSAPILPVKDIPKQEPITVPPLVEKKPEPRQENTKSTPPPHRPPIVPPVKKHNPQKTSRKSKLLGIIIAVLILIGLITLGYTIISSIMEKEATEKPDDSFKNDGLKSNGSNSTDALYDNESIEGEEVAPQAGAIGDDLESIGNTGTDNSKETELSTENSMESEMKEAREGFSDKSSSDQEKEAIKTKIIRKKGEFEIPSWIIAFSANSKKPLANTNYSTLEALGYDAGIYWIPKYFPGGSEMYKVYVGPYKSAKEAESMLPAIKNLQRDAYVLKIEE